MSHRVVFAMSIISERNRMQVTLRTLVAALTVISSVCFADGGAQVPPPQYQQPPPQYQQPPPQYQQPIPDESGYDDYDDVPELPMYDSSIYYRCDYRISPCDGIYNGLYPYPYDDYADFYNPIFIHRWWGAWGPRVYPGVRPGFGYRPPIVRPMPPMARPPIGRPGFGVPPMGRPGFGVPVRPGFGGGFRGGFHGRFR